MTKRPTLVALDAAKNQDNPKDSAQFYENICVDTLARTLWGEARGEGDTGMQAVANVIKNRYKIAQEKGAFWWGNDLIQICQKPYQFSCWNRADANYKKLTEVDSTDFYFASALRLARRCVHNALDDLTNGATHYHAKSITPYWAKGKEPCAEIGAHLFYKMVE